MWLKFSESTVATEQTEGANGPYRSRCNLKSPSQLIFCVGFYLFFLFLSSSEQKHFWLYKGSWHFKEVSSVALPHYPPIIKSGASVSFVGLSLHYLRLIVLKVGYEFGLRGFRRCSFWSNSINFCFNSVHFPFPINWSSFSRFSLNLWMWVKNIRLAH